MMEWATNGWALAGFSSGVLVLGFLSGLVAFYVLNARTLDRVVERTEEVNARVRLANEKNADLDQRMAKVRELQIDVIRRAKGRDEW